MPLPPLKDVLEQLQNAVLPAAGGAALLLCAFLLLGRRAGALGSAAAVVFGFVCGNFTLAKLEGAAPTWESTWRLVRWTPSEEGALGTDWLVRAGLVLVVVGLVSRWFGHLAERALPNRYWWGPYAVVWLPRVVAVFVASAWLVRGGAAEAPEWAFLRWAIVAVMLLMWVALDGLSRAGTGSQTAVYASAMLMTGAALLLYAHTAKLMEVAVILGSALFGVALASARARSGPEGHEPDTSGAVPAAVALLPGLVLGARPGLTTEVPAVAFWLVALAPVLLLPFLSPAITRTHGRWAPVLRAALLLMPLVIAVALAARYETLAFEEKW